MCSLSSLPFCCSRADGLVALDFFVLQEVLNECVEKTAPEYCQINAVSKQRASPDAGPK